MKKLILSLVIFINLVFADNAPIRISVQNAYNEAWGYFYPKILITSVVDKIKINNVKVNKGHCKYANFDIIFTRRGPKTIKLVPRTLGYGEELEIRLKSSCHLLRVDIDTDQGTWTMEY